LLVPNLNLFSAASADEAFDSDEVLYQARIHPEQYSNTFTDEQINRIHEKIVEVCGIACDTLADSSQFPDTWLMQYRWDKGKKHANALPTGEKIIHIKVGGRTSAVVPSVQKKTGPVAGDGKVEEDDALSGAEEEVKLKVKAAKNSKTKAAEKSAKTSPKVKFNGKKKSVPPAKAEPKLSGSRKRSAAEVNTNITATKKVKVVETEGFGGRRRSTRGK
jgi:formamidopyrimidine-DNA glycosylase